MPRAVSSHVLRLTSPSNVDRFGGSAERSARLTWSTAGDAHQVRSALEALSEILCTEVRRAGHERDGMRSMIVGKVI